MLSISKAREYLNILKTDYGITYKEIADELGIPQTAMYNFISGRKDFKYDRLNLIEEYLIKIKFLKEREEFEWQIITQ